MLEAWSAVLDRARRGGVARAPAARSSVVARGDAARDAGRWDAAAAHYADHLAQAPQDWAIWVQLGHARKESGDLDGALSAYESALAVAPQDADLHLQLGHLHKLAGRRREAVVAYGRALALDAEAARDAFGELVGLGAVREALAALRDAPGPRRKLSGACYEIGDLLIWFLHHSHVSGIQRVQLELCRQAMASAEPPSFVSFHPYGAPIEIDPDDLRRLLAAVAAGGRRAPRRIVEQIVRRSPHAFVDPSAHFVVLGAFWATAGMTAELARARRMGVRVVFYVYDAIPVLHPEYCDAALVRDFRVAFGQALFVADGFLTISEATRRDVAALCAEAGVDVPTIAVPLAHPMPVLEDPPDLAAFLGRHDLDGDFVLVVGTVEARKNHALLFHLWLKLWRELGEALPKLVFAGRVGWRVGDLMEQIAATGHVGGRLVLLSGLSDATLAALYRRCLFTVFPSFVEGWGLPVGESLVFGRPCVAARVSSLPEVGGDLVEYFDPWSLADAERAVRPLLLEPERRREAEARIARGFRPRGWAEVAQDFAAATRAVLAAPAGARGEGLPTFPANRWIAVGSGAAPSFAPAAALAFGLDHWHPVEDWGVWAAAAEAEIAFRCADDAPVLVYLRWRPCPARPGHAVSLEAAEGGAEGVAFARAAGSRLLRVLARPAGRIVRLRLRTVFDGEDGCLGEDARVLHAGVVGIGYASAADHAARVALLEAIGRHD